MKALLPFLGLLLAFLLTPVKSTSELKWHFETVDSIESCGPARLCLDSRDMPRMVFFDYYRGLKYAYKEGNIWHVGPVGTHLTGAWPSFRLDSSGMPHICDRSRHEEADTLYYIHREGAFWETEMVDTAQSFLEASLGLDGSALPHIAYIALADTSPVRWDLRYASWDGLAWEIDSVDSEVGSSVSLAFDSPDVPHVAYSDMPNGNLSYAYRDGSGWQFQVVDTSVSCGHFSLALDSLDRPHISYNAQSYLLKYAFWDGLSWQTEVIENAGSLLSHGTSLGLDSLDRPHIAYHDYALNARDLKYTHWDGAAWQIEDVDTAGDVGTYPSLVMDSHGFPHIGYGLVHSNAPAVRHAWKGELGLARGWVAYLYNGQPIECALVRADGYCDTTDAGGLYSMDIFPQTYDMTASAYGCNPDSVGGVVVGPGDTVVVNFYLTRPLISVEPSSFRVELPENDSSDTTLYISNPGDGPLEFRIEVWTGGPPSWLSASPASGWVGPGATLRDTIGFNTTGLDTGLYAGELRLPNNSADSLVTVPCTLHVVSVGVEEARFAQQVRRSFALHQNAPNPAAASTSIRFQLPRRSSAALKVYNLTGELVASLVDGLMEPGLYTVRWDGRDSSGRSLASGLYLYRLTVYLEGPVLPALRRAGGSEVEGSRGAGEPAPSSAEVFTATRKMVLLR